MHVSALWLYPIKSCRGISVDALELDERGARNDRRWMLVDESNTFVSQRTAPRLSLVDVEQTDTGLFVSAPAMSRIRIATAEEPVAAECIIWKDTVALQPAQAMVNRWFSELIGRQVRLMHMPAHSERVVNPAYSPARRLVSLADGYPLMLIGQGSLDLLNAKLVARGAGAIPMKRFRPNIVVEGAEPHAEDAWKTIRIGDVACSVVKPCERCTIPTVDTETGLMSKEPLRTLSEYRKVGSKVMFGQNLIHEQPGTIRLNDPVSI